MARSATIALASVLIATAGPAASAAAPPPRAPAGIQVEEPRTEHVVVISIDGLRGDAVARFAPPVLRRLAAEGSHSFDATTVVPSTTLPSHTSMLTGLSPAAHGVTWNIDMVEARGYATVPTMFSAATAAGLETAAFFGKSKLRYLAAPGTIGHVEAPENSALFAPGAHTVEQVAAHLETTKPNLLFVHLAELDIAGHTMGWMSPGYRAALDDVDHQVGAILALAEAAFGAGRYTAIITSDHGGDERGHGDDDPLELLIPWIAWGRSAASGERLTGVRTIDTAPTVLWLLGVSPPDGTEGVPLKGAFAAAAAEPGH